MQDAIDHAVVDHGVIVVAAMGNEYRHGMTHFPAGCEGVIAVGATRPDGTKADFSSEGLYISVCAPGEDIFSTIWTPGGDSFGTWSGTSMATPHVVGLVALLLTRTSSATLIRSRLERTASQGNTGWTRDLGYGVVNAYAAYNDTDPDDLYGGLTVTVTGTGSVADAEVLVRTNVVLPVTKGANRTNVDGVAHFPYLKADSYLINVTKGPASGSTTVTVSAGGTVPVTVTLATP